MTRRALSSTEYGVRERRNAVVVAVVVERKWERGVEKKRTGEGKVVRIGGGTSPVSLGGGGTAVAESVAVCRWGKDEVVLLVLVQLLPLLLLLLHRWTQEGVRTPFLSLAAPAWASCGGRVEEGEKPFPLPLARGSFPATKSLHSPCFFFPFFRRTLPPLTFLFLPPPHTLLPSESKSASPFLFFSHERQRVDKERCTKTTGEVAERERAGERVRYKLFKREVVQTQRRKRRSERKRKKRGEDGRLLLNIRHSRCHPPHRRRRRREKTLTLSCRRRRRHSRRRSVVFEISFGSVPSDDLHHKIPLWSVLAQREGEIERDRDAPPPPHPC
jgi:hypothetical protein